jgi:hypothetical protein
MKRTVVLSAVAGALALSGCAGTPPPPATPVAVTQRLIDNPPRGYDELVARAEREIKRADDQGFLWLETESHLAAARDAYQVGDTDRAMQLAQKALEEALLAQQQAAESAKTKADFTHRR